MTTLSRPENTADLAILGAGPTGLFAAYYAGFRGLSTVLIDSLAEPGGQVTAMYPEKLIFDVAGFPAIRGRDLVNALVEQADRYQPRYLFNQMARTLSRLESGGFDIGLADGSIVRAGAVLITAGLGEFRPRPLPVGTEWLGKGLSYFVPKLEAHRGQDVVVVGGGDSAFDWVLALFPIAKSVTLVHRRKVFRAHRGTVAQVEELGIPVITEAEIVAIYGDEVMREVQVAFSDGKTITLSADAVIAALGFIADLGPLESWGLTLERRAIMVDTTMRTNRDRIYAAGDVAAYPGKVRLIATGFGEAATAVNNIAVALNPEAHLFPGHSTNT